MKVFVDECVDWRFSRDIAGHEVKTARQMGWTTIKNGDLLVPDLLAAIPAAKRGAVTYVEA